jgi:hypothetical protein
MTDIVDDDSVGIENQPINLSKLAPAKVVGLIINVERITYTKVSGVKEILEIPDNLKDRSLLNACFWHLQSAYFYKLAKTTQDAHFTFVRQLIEFIINAPENMQFSAEIPSDIAFLYLNYCMSLKQLNETIRKKVQFIGVVLINITSEKLIAQNGSDIINKIWDERFRVILTKIPEFIRYRSTNSNAVTDPRVIHTAHNKGLGEIFPDCPYTDTELINSIRTFSHWMLMELKRQRHILLDIPEVKKTLDELLNNHTAQEAPVLLLKAIPADKALRSEHRALYHTLVYGALKTKDPLLLERVYLDIHYDDEFSSDSDRDQDKMRGYIENRSHGAYFKSDIHSIRNTTYADLIIPSRVEVLLFSWLLASDRCQNSGVELAKLDHMAFNKTGVQFFYYKDRKSITSAPENSSPIYKRNTPIHEVYRYWVDFMTSAQKNLPTDVQGSLCPAFKTTKEIREILINKTSTALVYNMTIPSSIWRKAYIDKVGDNANPFLWLLGKVTASNAKTEKVNVEYTTVVNHYKKNGRIGEFPVRKDYLKGLVYVGISSNAIAISRVQMEDGVDVREKGDVPAQEFDPNKVSEIKTALLAHSVKTHKNIYGNNSNSVEKIESMKKFSAQVGDLMAADAYKIQHLIDNSKTIDLNALKQMLGIEKPIDSLENLLDETDNNGLLGEINYEGIKYFVTTDLTSALIQGYIYHIKQSIPKARLESDKLAKSLLLESMYLSEVLSSFPQSMITKGNKLLEEHDFPYPSVL